jgi:hypothetical protein
MNGKTATGPDPLPGWGDRYLARRAMWDWHDPARIDILSLDGQLIATLDPWQTAVFHGADASTKLSEFLAWVRASYQDGAEIPADLDETISKCLTYLSGELHAVEFCDRSQDLPYYFDLPKQEQDRDEAMQAMKEDGLIFQD